MSDDDPGGDDGLNTGSGGGDVRPAEPPGEHPPATQDVPRRRRLLAFTALGLGVAAAIACLYLLVSPSSAGWLVALGFAVAGVVCAVVALERRSHRPPALWAVSLAGLSLVFAIAGLAPQADLEAHVYGYASGPVPGTSDSEEDASSESTASAGCPELPEAPADVDATFFYGSMYAADLDQLTSATPAVLSYEQPIRLASTATGDEIMSMTAGTPIDVTQAAATGAVDPPTRGVYLAVPVSYTDPDYETLACFTPAWPSTWWVTGTDEIDLATVSIPGYPTLEEGGIATTDSAMYYDIFDVSPDDVATGMFEVVLLAPDLEQQVIYWGAVSP